VSLFNDPRLPFQDLAGLVAVLHSIVAACKNASSTSLKKVLSRPFFTSTLLL
jgi:hypothetical protein